MALVDKWKDWVIACWRHELDPFVSVCHAWSTAAKWGRGRRKEPFHLPLGLPENSLYTTLRLPPLPFLFLAFALTLPPTVFFLPSLIKASSLVFSLQLLPLWSPGKNSLHISHLTFKARPSFNISLPGQQDASMQALISFSPCAFPFPFPLLNSYPLTLTLPFPLNCPFPSIPFSILTPTWPCCHVSAGSILSLPLSYLPCWHKGKTVQPPASARTLTRWIVAVED